MTAKKAKSKTKKKTKSKPKSKRTKIVCVSHKEDADGICSAALIKQAFDTDSYLEDYPSLMETLNKIKDDEIALLKFGLSWLKWLLFKEGDFKLKSDPTSSG